MSRRKKKNSAGRAVIVVLCILLIGACAVLMFKDRKRDFRHGVYRCKDGRLMEEPAVPDQEIIDGVREGTELLAKAHPEIRQYMMLVPSAACIQSEYLPENAGKVRDQAQDLAQIQGVLQQNLEWVDLTGLFNDHKGEKLFYATAPYLTGWGSRYAAKAAVSAMGAEFPKSRETCYLLSDTYQGNLASDRTLMQKYGEHPGERIEIYVPEDEPAYYRIDEASGVWYGTLYDSSSLDSEDPFNVFFGGDRPLTEIYSAAINGETLLVIGDRTANSIVPLFVSSFEKIILVHPSESTRSLMSLAEKYQPTKILYLYGANTFMKDRSLLRIASQ